MSKKTGRSLGEKIAAERAGPLQSALIKATDSEALPPKEKHLQALIKYSFFQESCPTIAQTLVERTKKKSWIPVLKSLVTSHRLLRDASKDFARMLSGIQGPFQLGYFTDSTSPEAAHLSVFIQRYSIYLNQKVQCFKKLGYDYCHCKSVAEGDQLARISPPDIFELLEIVLDQMSTVLDITDGDEINSIVGNLVVKEATTYLFKDVLRLWICANSASCNMLERYFTMEKKQAQITLRLYEQFVKLCNRTDKFVKVCSLVGCNDGKSIPSLGEAPSVLLPKLREYIQQASSSVSRPARPEATAPPSLSPAAPAPAAADPFGPAIPLGEVDPFAPADSAC
eukprot:m.441613 g.441613  ORF g.441613 m.441613 type:complete len:339 (+) comp18686_c0_seq1:75-1091(+)